MVVLASIPFARDSNSALTWILPVVTLILLSQAS
jgi:hypothetical protein